MLDVRVEENCLDVVYSFSEDKDIIMRFEKWMFNNLMTFSQVSLQNKKNGQLDVLNEAYSDNIGPMKVAGSSYVGGNHRYNDNNVLWRMVQNIGGMGFTHGSSLLWMMKMYLFMKAPTSRAAYFSFPQRKFFRESRFCPTIQTSVFL